MSLLNAYQPLQPGAEKLVLSIHKSLPQAGEEHACNKTVTGLFEAKVKQRPDRVALECRNVELTYRELNKRSNQLAYYLKRKYDIGRGDVVAIMMQRSEWLLTAVLGVLKSGAAYFPVESSCTTEQRSNMFADNNVKLVLTDFEGLPGYAQLALRRDWLTISTITDRRPSCEHEPGDLACILYSEEPLCKTLITHHTIVRTLTDLEKIINVTAKDKLLAITASPFDVWVTEFFLPLITGAQVLLATAEEINNGESLQNLLREKQPTLIQSSAIHSEQLQKNGWSADNLKVIYRPADSIVWCRCKTR